MNSIFNAGIFGFGTLFEPVLYSPYHKLTANINVNVTRTTKDFEGIVLAPAILSFLKFHRPTFLSSRLKSSLKNQKYVT